MQIWPIQLAQVNQPREGSRCHPGCQGRQSAWPKLYTEQGSDAPSAARWICPRRDFQSDSSHAVLLSRMEARPHYLHSETWEQPGTTLVVLPISRLDTNGKLF